MASTSYNRLVAMILGWVLVLVGVLGFIPGITADGPGPATGHGTPAAKLLGLFEVNMAHSAVHLISGLFLLAGAYMSGGANARMANMILGVVYVIVFLVGLLVAPIADAVAINAFDNGLHLVLGIALLGVAFMVKDDAAMGMGQKPMT